MKILFLVRALNLGGAQSQMVLLARQLRERGHEVNVVAFYGGPHKQALQDADVGVHVLNKRGRWDIFGFLWRLIQLTRRLAPDILYGYLATCNLLVSLLQLFTPRAQAVWGIRTAKLKLEYYGWLTRCHLFLERRCAWLPALIITNSHAGQRHALAEGFPIRKTVVTPNGIDTEMFYHDPAARARTRARWKIADDALVIGIVGRIDPIKEHALFLTAAHKLQQHHTNAYFVCVGEAANPAYQSQLYALTAELGLQERVIWTGAQYDMLGVYNALDILTNTSSSEGFSNVIGEAMSCQIPCVVTDVGDSALIVGHTGIVVPVSDADALVVGWQQCWQQNQYEMGQRARQRIRENFSAHELMKKTEAAFMAIVEHETPHDLITQSH